MTTKDHSLATVLAVVREADFRVRQVSANVAELLDRSVDTVLGSHLSALVGADPAARISDVDYTPAPMVPVVS